MKGLEEFILKMVRNKANGKKWYRTLGSIYYWKNIKAMQKFMK